MSVPSDPTPSVTNFIRGEDSRYAMTLIAGVVIAIAIMITSSPQMRPSVNTPGPVVVPTLPAPVAPSSGCQCGKGKACSTAFTVACPFCRAPFKVNPLDTGSLPAKK